jgi:hypothetical protein
MIESTVGADIKVSCTDPVLELTAFFADKAIGQLLVKQIIITGLRV